jgi:hypothetical protein
MGLLSRAARASGIPDVSGVLPDGFEIRSGVPAASGQGGVKNDIRAYHRVNPSFQGIVLENGGDVPDNTAGMISSFGIAIALPSRNTLILFPPSLDRELIAHRLSKSLHRTCVCTFTADNPDSAFAVIQPFI